MKPLQTACTIVLVAVVCIYLALEIRHARDTTYMSSDEAASVIAATEILHSGLPRVPSGRIYYRSPLSHYLDAVSIAILGKRELGWRGASLAAYALLLLLPGLMLIRRRQPLLAPLWAALVGLMNPIQTIAYSARMYMVYTFFCTLSLLLAILWAPTRYDRRGKLYLACAIAAALAHQHFVVFIPGLLLSAAVVWLERRPLPLARYCASPMIVAPIVALAITMLFQFGDNGKLFPNAWANTASQGMPMGKAASFLYPLEVFGIYSPVQPAFLFVAMLAWAWISRRSFRAPPTVTTHAVIIVLTSYLLVALLLPYQLYYYVSPLWPLFYFAIFSVCLDDPEPVARWGKIAALAATVALGVFIGNIEARFHQDAAILSRSWHTLAEKPSPTPLRQWNALRAFVATSHAVVISSEPETSMPHVGHVSAHVRWYGVHAATPCSEVIDDFQPIPFAHHPCQLEAIIAGARAKSVPVLFIGGRLGGTVGTENTNYIRSKFTHIGEVDYKQVYCIGDACAALQRDYAQASR